MKETLVLQTRDVKDIVIALQRRLKPKTFLGLRGEMGAGKTTLVAQMLRDQHVDVASPTFALYNTYYAYGLAIVHVDLYRLDSPDDIDSAGFWDLFADSNSVIVTEWVERISVAEIPLDWVKWFLQIQVGLDGQREYSLFSYQ